MNTNEVIFELQRGGQFFKNPTEVRTEDGGYKKIGYARGVKGIDVDKHPSGITYELVYFPYTQFTISDPSLIEFLKSQQTFSKKPNEGRIWIHNPVEKAKQGNEARMLYVAAMNYIESLSGEELSAKAFAKIGVNNKLDENQIKEALYNIADENPQEILDLKDNSTYDFIGKAIYNNVIELVKDNFYLYGERNNLLFQTPNGLNSKERFAEFLQTKEGRPIVELIESKLPKKPSKTGKIDNNDLSQIRGIGMGFERELRSAGINTLLELNKHTEDSLTSKLRNNGFVIPKLIKVSEILERVKGIVDSNTIEI